VQKREELDVRLKGYVKQLLERGQIWDIDWEVATVATLRKFLAPKFGMISHIASQTYVCKNIYEFVIYALFRIPHVS